MTDFNNSQDILDVRDIIARVEELREELTPWACGFNMPGYMPDSDPAAFGSWEDARDCLIEELGRAIDEIPEEGNADLQTDIEGAVTRLEALKEGEAFGETVGKWHYWLTHNDSDHGADSDAAELKELEELLKELCGNGGDEQWNGDWYPITLIRDSYFEEYAQDLAQDVGAIKSDSVWPYTCIDWEQAAKELQMDYTTCEYGNVTYWYR